MWYHLSQREKLLYIVSANDEHSTVTGYISPTVPKKSYGEKETPRVCIAPTVGQCLISIPHESGIFYIYEVKVKNPLKPDRVSGVADLDWTHEHWVTEEVIKENGGKINLSYEGYYKMKNDDKLQIKILIEKKKFPLGDSLREKKKYWQIKNDKWNFSLIK